MELADLMDPTTVPGLITSIISGTLLLGGLVLWKWLKGKLDRVLGQTENSHENTEYPNLRDEITAIRALTEQNNSTGEEMAKVMNRLVVTVDEDRIAARRETEGVRQDVRALGQRVDLHIATVVVSRQAPPSDTL